MTAKYLLDNPVSNFRKSSHNSILRNYYCKSHLAIFEQKFSHIAKSQHPVHTLPGHTRLPRCHQDIQRMALDNPDREGFIKATATEIASIRSMNTWDPADNIPLTIPKSDIGCSKLVYDKKYHPDGTFDKYKARLVFRGDKWYDQYHNKTYAGTVMSESVRMLLAIAAAQDLELQSADVRSAFLYGEIPDNQFIYMRRPPGLTDSDMPPLVRLRKCIYGLPMASAKFRAHSDATLRNMGFTSTVSDPRIYVKFYPDETRAYVSVHVDDFGVAASNLDMIKDIMDGFRNTYNITINIELNYYLGMLIWRDRPNRTIKLSQPGYINDLVETYNINITKPPITPMIDIPRPLASDSNPQLSTEQKVEYQAKVGSLLWIANGTRPDCLYPVNIRSRYTHNPTAFDMKAVDRILEYIAGTPDLGLLFKSDQGVILSATVDASYGNHDDRKSHSACTLHIGRDSGAFISRSKKQTVTADSSTVAEFIAAHLATKEIMWARSLLAELGHPQLEPTILYEDNMSTIHMINNDCNSQKTKHIDIRYNLVREQVQKRHLTMLHLSTKEMTSDILTKALGPTPFMHLRTKLLGMYSHLNIWDLMTLVAF